MSRRSSRGAAWERLRRVILDRDGWRCTKCGRPGKLEVHHIRPVAQGGDDSPDNLRTLCVDDHLSEHTDPERMAWRFELARLARG